MREQRAFGFPGTLVRALRHRLCRGIAARDFDQFGRVQQLVGEFLDLVGERRGPEQVLPFGGGGQQRHDPLDVRDEAHVEHPVRLVEDEDLDMRQVDAFLFDVIEQAARGGDEDLDAGAHDGKLLLDIDAAEDAGRAQSCVLAVNLDLFLDLDRELTRRRQDQCTHRMPGGRRTDIRLGLQTVQDGKSKPGRLAGTRLGAAHDVASCHYHRDCLRLDRRGRGVTALGHGPQNLRAQAELDKARNTH